MLTLCAARKNACAANPALFLFGQGGLFFLLSVKPGAIIVLPEWHGL